MWSRDTMAQERAPPLQDTFLKHVQEHGVPVTVFLMSGIRLQGYITRFDSYGVALTRDHQTQFVYKHVISWIHPLTPVQLYAGSNDIES
jgi:host factor-I protein